MKQQKKDHTRLLLEKYDYSWPRSKNKEAKMQNASSEPISMKDAVRLFDGMYEVFTDLFNYPNDGCYVRAHMTCGYLFEKGIRPNKAWWIYENNEEKKPVNLRKVGLEWSFHVASAINVQSYKDEKPVMVVMDPMIFDGPVTVSAWAGALGVSAAQVIVKSYDEGFVEGQGGMYRPRKQMKDLGSIELYDDFQRYNSFVNVKVFPNRYQSKLRADFEKAQDGLLKAHYTKNAKVIKPRLSI